MPDLNRWIGAIGTLAPFLAPYPDWVKLAFAVCILSGAAFFVGLVVAAPGKGPATEAAAPSGTEPTAWLTIKGVTGFGASAGQSVRVTAMVNGAEYKYPNARGINWLEIGPEMAPQTYQIPVRDVYTVRFSADLKSGTQLVSVEEQHINKKTDGTKTYGVRELDRGQRAAAVSAEIRYVISQCSP